MKKKLCGIQMKESNYQKKVREKESKTKSGKEWRNRLWKEWREIEERKYENSRRK